MHDEQVEQDAARTEYLEGYGFRVLRFRNAEVLDDLDTVLARIAVEASSVRHAPRPSHPAVFASSSLSRGRERGQK